MVGSSIVILLHKLYSLIVLISLYEHLLQNRILMIKTPIIHILALIFLRHTGFVLTTQWTCDTGYGGTAVGYSECRVYLKGGRQLDSFTV